MIKIKTSIAFIIGIFKLLFTFGKSKCKIYDDEVTVEKVLENKCSLIRLGDGEYRMIVKGKDIHYQKFEKKLQEEMKNIIKTYNKDSKYLLCVPQSVIYERGTWFFNHDIKYFTHFIDFRFYFRYFMNKKVNYGDAMLFTKENEENYERLWKYKKNIIFVHNDEKWAKSFKQKYNKNVEFVGVPNRDSYSVIDDIEKEIVRKVESIDRKDYVVLLSAGPMAKCLVYRLVEKDILAYDCGHCWDEPLIFKK